MDTYVHIIDCIQYVYLTDFVDISLIFWISIQKNETEDGKTYRRSYHYINYQLFVNVAKYKLDQMRKKIKSETREVCMYCTYKLFSVTCYSCVAMVFVRRYRIGCPISVQIVIPLTPTWKQIVCSIPYMGYSGGCIVVLYCNLACSSCTVYTWIRTYVAIYRYVQSINY